MQKLTPLLVDAKNEYTNKLTDILAPAVINAFNGVYVQAMTTRGGGGIAGFQRKLREVSRWNSSTIQAQVTAIEKQYPFLEDLIAAVFVACVRIMSSVKVHAREPSVNLQLPQTETFVHKVFTESSIAFFADPRLIKADRATRWNIVHGAVAETIRKQLPMGDILRAYVGNAVSGDTVNTGELDYEEFSPTPAQAPAQAVQPLVHTQPQPQLHPSTHASPAPVYAQPSPAQHVPSLSPDAVAQIRQVLASPAASASRAASPVKTIRVPGAFVTPDDSPGLFSDAGDF